MPLDLAQLPNTFYRVSVKALIFDDQKRLLVFQDKNGFWEIPGGGWDREESLEDCIRREIKEEMQLEPVHIAGVKCVYRCIHEKGYYKVCIAAPVTIQSADFLPSGDDLVAARYVGKEELISLPFQQSEAGVLGAVDEIWKDRE